jgi:hypothetical protein
MTVFFERELKALAKDDHGSKGMHDAICCLGIFVGPPILERGACSVDPRAAIAGDGGKIRHSSGDYSSGPHPN